MQGGVPLNGVKRHWGVMTHSGLRMHSDVT